MLQPPPELKASPNRKAAEADFAGIGKAARADLKGQKPACLWMTGLSGAGKSTVACLLEHRLHSLGRHTYILDGDKVRLGLCAGLGFSDADRIENMRRVREVARMMVDAGLIVIVALISPFRADRKEARRRFEAGEFLEIYIDTPLETCEQRDPKGLYRKMRAEQLANFTGISSRYEPPEAPEFTLHCGSESPAESVDRLLAELRARGIVS